MIVKQVRGNILASGHKHIVFAVNAEGHNDAGFAGLVAERYWGALLNTGGNKLGEVLTKATGGHIFHAIVCHDFAATGWSKAPELVEKGLNSLDVADDEEIGVVLIGGGPIGQMSGANPQAILEAMQRSQKRISVYSL